MKIYRTFPQCLNFNRTFTNLLLLHFKQFYAFLFIFKFLNHHNPFNPNQSSFKLSIFSSNPTLINLHSFFTYSSTHPLTQSPTYLPIHPLTHSPTHPLTYPLTHPPTHPPTHLLTHSSTHLYSLQIFRQLFSA